MRDKALSNAELELTQRIQMHFPRGSIPSGVLQEWNSCSTHVLSAWVAKCFQVLPFSTTIERSPGDIIDCDADPYDPLGYTLVEHRPGGKFKWGPHAAALWWSEEQKNEPNVDSEKLEKEIPAGALNANVLSYLLAFPFLIPEDWKGKNVFFWGTRYRNSVGNRFVPFLRFTDDRWHWDMHWVKSVLYRHDPAALSKSSEPVFHK